MKRSRGSVGVGFGSVAIASSLVTTRAQRAFTSVYLDISCCKDGWFIGGPCLRLRTACRLNGKARTPKRAGKRCFPPRQTCAQSLTMPIRSDRNPYSLHGGLLRCVGQGGRRVPARRPSAFLRPLEKGHRYLIRSARRLRQPAAQYRRVVCPRPDVENVRAQMERALPRENLL
jgi:hypothetical protein